MKTWRLSNTNLILTLSKQRSTPINISYPLKNLEYLFTKDQKIKEMMEEYEN